MNLNVKIKITNQDIDDIVCCALEGGINYWCSECKVVGDYLGEWAHEQISRGGVLRLYDSEDGTVYELTLVKFIHGIERYISNYSNCGNIVINGEVDACEVDGYIADIIIQLAIFDEVIFG